MAETFRIHSVLRSMRHEARCVLVIWREESSTGRLYTRGKITEESPDLPDGSYTLSFGEHRIVTRKWEGHWLLKYLPGNVALGQAA